MKVIRAESQRDHFARPYGGFTTPEKPYRCTVCERPVRLRRGSRTVWEHATRPWSTSHLSKDGGKS